MKVLGIETSCDETAAAVILNEKVLSSEVSSSVHLHSQYGGVVPEIASRYHTEFIYPVTEEALKKASYDLNDIDLIAVTKGPGLPGSLLVGISFAKAVSSAKNIPIIGINHLHAHIFSCFLGKKETGKIEDVFPFLGVVVSGGHTSIYVCNDFEDLSLIGRTKDDAVGEAFDKVAKVLDLGYPGGPIVEKRALMYNKTQDINFPRALLKDKDDIDFSFSGIKTAVMYYWRDTKKTEEEKDRVCYSFQEAVADVIVQKIKRAARITGLKKIAVGGGVINNTVIRDRLIKTAGDAKFKLFMPEKEYCSDNAAMIAALGKELFLKGQRSDLFMTASPSGE